MGGILGKNSFTLETKLNVLIFLLGVKRENHFLSKHAFFFVARMLRAS